MKLELTESAKKFIETLNEEDLTKVTFTGNTMESDYEGISNKFMAYAKERLRKIGEKIEETNARLRVEHPEYFE